MKVYLDIETRSSVDLKKYGVYPYSESPDFRILMAAWSCDGEPVWAETDLERNLDIFKTYRALGATFVAHNAPFERVCLSRALGMPVGEYLPPEMFHDT